MRLFAGLLVLVAAVIQLLLGITYLASTRYQPSVRPWLLGTLLLLLTVADVSGGVLLLLHRSRRAVLVAIALSVLGLGGVLAVDGLITVGLLALALLLFGLVGAILASRSAHD